MIPWFSVIPERFQRPLLYAGTALAMFTLLGLGKCVYDRHVVNRHDAEIAARVAGRAVKTSDRVAETRRTDDARIEAEARELERIADEQTDLQYRLARQRCIRVQQLARQRGVPTPACD